MTEITIEMWHEINKMVAMHDTKKKIWQEILDDIATLSSRSDIHVDGGDGKTPSERNLIMYERACKRYKRLLEDIEIVELALNGIIFADYDGEEHGTRMMKAIKWHCANPRKITWNKFEKRFGLTCGQRWYHLQKRKFIEDMALRLGYIGGYEIVLTGGF